MLSGAHRYEQQSNNRSVQSPNSDITETPEACFPALCRSINTSGLGLTAQSVRLTWDLEGTFASKPDSEFLRRACAHILNLKSLSAG